MIRIDHYAYRSALRYENANLKACFAIMTMVIMLFFPSTYLAVASCILMLILNVRLGKLPMKAYIQLMMMPMVFLLMSLMGIIVSFDGEEALFYRSVALGSGYLGFTSSGMKQGGILFLNALACVSCMYFLILNTPMVDLLSAMRRAGLPKLIISIMELMYRFITILIMTADMLFVAQTARLGYSNLRRAYRSLGELVAALFIKAMRQTDQLHVALMARGYDGDIRILDETKKADKVRMLAVTLFEVLFLLLAIILH